MKGQEREENVVWSEWVSVIFREIPNQKPGMGRMECVIQMRQDSERNLGAMTSLTGLLLSIGGDYGEWFLQSKVRLPRGGNLGQ